MALKKSQLYSSLWQSCDELRGGMDASQYKDYVLTLLFMKYVSDKYAGRVGALIEVPDGGGFADMAVLKGDKEIGDKINKIITRLAEANDLKGVIDQADFNDDTKLGAGKEMRDRLSKLVAIFDGLDFRANRAAGDDLLGDAYEYLMLHFATESGKSKGQFYTPAEVSRIMAKVIGIDRAGRRHQPTVYDPTCGSGSLLIKAADEAATRTLSIYGQEKDVATWSLARMNMILHDHPTAELRRGNTLSAPDFKHGDGSLRTFDFAVANPPFSDKAWSNGLDPQNDEFGRFELGVPPPGKGDYAFLLHLLKSLKSTGKGAIILPHGVLFRGDREADIRRRLVDRGLIAGIVGLPPNLFFGTGIPACIVVVDKKDSRGRSGLFMVDASRGFLKDGSKNRLRAQDIHRIVDVFTRRTEVARYSRMVPLAEIAAHDYNLHISRYINSSEPDDLHDLDAHLNGGIPLRDVDALGSYWRVFPGLRQALFDENGREGYLDLRIPPDEIQETTLRHPDFRTFAERVTTAFKDWCTAHGPALRSIRVGDSPRDLINTLSEDLLARFAELPLLDPYDIYQRLMDYWDEVMQDDVYLIASDGWAAGRGLRPARDDEPADLSVKKGRKTVKYVGEIIPTATVVARFFARQQAELTQLEARYTLAVSAKAAFDEEHGRDDGPLAGLQGKGGRPGKAKVLQRVMDLREGILMTFDEASRYHTQARAVKRSTFGSAEWNRGLEDPEGRFEELDLLHDWLRLAAEVASSKKSRSTAEACLRELLFVRYDQFTDREIKNLVVRDKWLATLRTAVGQVVQELPRRQALRLTKLHERYTRPLSLLRRDAEAASATVDANLRLLGLTSE